MSIASAFTVILSQGPSIFYKKIQVLRMVQSGQGHNQMGYRPMCERELSNETNLQICNTNAVCLLPVVSCTH